MGRRLLIFVPYFWLLALFLIPFLMVFRISLSDYDLAQPPYSPHFTGNVMEVVRALDWENYTFIFGDSLYLNSFLSSLRIAIISTLLTLAIGYPMAYAMARAPRGVQPLLVMLVILPFWTSFLIRVYAWIGILKSEGLLNLFLMSIGVISEPLSILNTNTAVYIGIVYAYLPFMILPLYATLEKMDDSLLEAAEDLGCSRMEAFWRITIPLSLPGIIAGSFLVFIPAMGEFVIPDLLGGSNTLMIGKTLWVEFFNNRDWPVAASVAMLLLAILIVPIVLFQKVQEKEAGL